MQNLYRDQAIASVSSTYCTHSTEAQFLGFINGYLWLIGGYINLSGTEAASRGQSLEVVDKEIWRYDPMLSNWKKIETTGEPPKTMASHAACSFDKVIKYFF